MCVNYMDFLNLIAAGGKHTPITITDTDGNIYAEKVTVWTAAYFDDLSKRDVYSIDFQNGVLFVRLYA